MHRAALSLLILAPLAFSADPAPTRGAQLFAEKCASCHGMDGAKALEAGPPLREREVPDADMEIQVVGRLEENTPQPDREALIAFVRTLTKRPKP